MISKSELYRKLRREVGDQIFHLVSESFIEEVIHDESLRLFSEYYPLLVSVLITRADAVPYRDYNGKVYNFRMYKIPQSPSLGQLGNDQEYEWRDIENYYMTANDTSDIYSGGNFMLNQFFLSARSSMPHTRSYYMITFTEPDTLIVDPPLTQHRNFTVVMQANRTLATVPRNMQELFMQLCVADLKIALYNKFKHETGNQVYGGVEIETKIDDFSDAKGDRERLIEIFSKDWSLNPERFETMCLYQNKS